MDQFHLHNSLPPLDTLVRNYSSFMLLNYSICVYIWVSLFLIGVIYVHI